jgi:hypothetical protein
MLFIYQIKYIFKIHPNTISAAKNKIYAMQFMSWHLVPARAMGLLRPSFTPRVHRGSRGSSTQLRFIYFFRIFLTQLPSLALASTYGISHFLFTSQEKKINVVLITSIDKPIGTMNMRFFFLIIMFFVL